MRTHPATLAPADIERALVATLRAGPLDLRHCSPAEERALARLAAAGTVQYLPFNRVALTLAAATRTTPTTPTEGTR